MIERELERRIVERIGRLGLDGLQVVGVWGGRPEEAEASAAKAVLAVVVRPRQYEAYLSSRAEFAVALTLSVRIEACGGPDGLEYYAAALTGVLEGWQESIGEAKADLWIENEFSPAGVRVDGGDVELDTDRGAWVVQQTFSVRGIVTRR